MDIYKLNWTPLQNKILRFLTINAGSPKSQREIAKTLKASPTAIANSLKQLKKEQLATLKKQGNLNLNLIELNRENQMAIEFKQTENLRLIYETRVITLLEEKFPGSTIILFGSYSRGEDTIKSDIDIAIIDSKEKTIELEQYEKILNREITINFYDSFKSIHKHLQESLCNGIVLSGGIELE